MSLPEQRAFGLGVVWVEFVDLGVEQVGEEEGVVFGAGGGWDFGVKAAPLLGCIAGHKRLADGFGVCEDSGLDGFLFCGGLALFTRQLLGFLNVKPISSRNRERRLGYPLYVRDQLIFSVSSARVIATKQFLRSSSISLLFGPIFVA